MSLETNKAVAVKFLTSMGSADGVDEGLVTQDCEWWARGQGTMTIPQLKQLVVKMKPLMPQVPEMTVVGLTAEDDRVAAEVTGKCLLATGKRYDNVYHFLLHFKNGKICKVKEFCDTQLAASVLGTG